MASDFTATTFVNQVGAVVSNPHKDSFSFNGTALSIIPDDISKLASRLVMLDLSKNRISELPICLSSFAQLKWLKLRGNVLKNIPEGIFSGMKELTELDLVDNELEALPMDLGQISSLERLSLTGNRLTSLPSSLTLLTSLRELLLGENQLTALPDDLEALKSLEKLDVQENLLTALPPSITLCTTLRSLSFHTNKLTSLPDKLWLLESLGGLHMQDNLFDEAVIPPKLLSKRAKAILSYLLAVSEGRTDDATEILEYSMSVPMKQKSASRIAAQRNTGSIDPNKPLARESSGFGATKPPPSPRHPEPVASEIPSGIVSRASMSLRRASTIMDSPSEKSAINSGRGPRPSGRSVLNRAPSQVTDAAHTPSTPSGTSSPSTGGRQRPQSIAVPPHQNGPGISPRPSPVKTPKVNAHPPTHNAKVPPTTPNRPKIPALAHTKQPPSPNRSPAVSPKPKTPATPQRPANNPTINRPHYGTQGTKGLKISGTIPIISESNEPHALKDLPEVEQLQPHDSIAVAVDASKQNDVAGKKDNVETVDSPGVQHLPTATEELSFDLIRQAKPPMNPTDSQDIFVEAISTPTTQPSNVPSETSTPVSTARLTVEDAKPLIMRENSVPTDGTSEFVFVDAAAAQVTPDGPQPTVAVPDLAVADTPADSPRTKSPKVKPDPAPKKPKKPKVQTEVVETVAVVTPSLTPTNSSTDPLAIRGRAKTRKIIGGESSVGTPFYTATDIAYLPRKLQNVPMMKLTSKRFLMTSRTNSQVAWKDMFSADNLTLMPSGAYVGYANHFQNEDHINFIGEDRIDGGAIVVSFLKKANSDTDVNCIIRTKDGDSALLIPIPDKKPKDNAGWLALLRQNSDFAAVVPKRVHLRPMLSPQAPAQLAELESKLHRPFFKFGIVYCKEGQTEEEDYLANEEGSSEFDEFLNWIGDKVTLQGWTKFDGGLDTQKNATGTESVYTEWNDLSIMFHVSTMLPMLPKSVEVEDSDQEKEDRTQEKKVHIGNDIVLIVFLEGETSETTFNPRKFVSHFNHAFIIVNPVRQKGLTLYRINTIYKSDVQPCLPSIPADAIFEKSDRLRDLLLTKLVNSERSACLGEQFAQSLASLRFHKLHNLAAAHAPKAGGGGCFAGCAGKK